MSTTATHAAHDHKVPLWGLFLALLALTAAEVGLYELWLHGAKAGHPFIPKYALVLLILIVLTLPKGAIVMIYFMHLKFEKQFVVFLSLIPFLFAAVCVLPALADIRANTPIMSARPAAILGHGPAPADHDSPGETSHAPEAQSIEAAIPAPQE